MSEEKENKKTNNTVIALLVFVIMILCIGVGYLIGTNNNVKLESKKDTEIKKTGKDSINNKNEGKWKSIGTDISKVQNVYDELYNYIYKSSRVNGGYSFYDKELISIAADQFKEEDFTDIEKDQYGYTYHAKVDKAKVDKILEKYFGNQYNYDYNLNRNVGLSNEQIISDWKTLGGGNLYSVLNYDKGTKKFIIYYHGADGTSGPEAQITTRKIIDVFEKDDSIKVIEKAIYYTTDYSNKDIYYNVFANPSHTLYLGAKKFAIEGIENQKLTVDDYLDVAGTITSIYKKDSNGNYIFVSSEILDKPL